ncbi:MAG TPA: c-type cytochrome [Gemmatimonadaceae bacterium]|nr:c-type cytochrome [Gemmatimonadaceae bacterium]
MIAWVALALAVAGAGLVVSARRRTYRMEPSIRLAAPAGALSVVAFRVPADSELRDSAVRASALRGRAIARATRESLPEHVGNALRCVSCHPDDGTRAGAMPWVGVYARFPQYRSRSGRVITLEDRINDCFERSMNGRALAPRGRDVADMVAYMAFLSVGVPQGAAMTGQGIPAITPPLAGDTLRARAAYAAECARCHGADGLGGVAPPLWGPQSYNVGAGMSRVRTAAAFIRHAMPFDRPGTLTDQQAFDLAALINARPRPDFPGKENDWPLGDPPPDVAYPTTAAVKARRPVRPAP